VVRRAKQALRLLAPAIALAILEGCGGSGGDAMPPAMSTSGTLDTTYGAGGRISVASSDIAVDRSGNAFVGGLMITKFDANGRPAADFVDGAPASMPQTHVAVDASGNVYSIAGGADGHFALVKRDATGRPVESFGQAGRVDLSAGGLVLLDARGVFTDGAGNVYVYTLWRPPASARPVFHFITKFDATGHPVAGFGAGTSFPGTLQLPSVFEFQGPAVTVDSTGNLYVVVPTITGLVVAEKLDASGQPAAGFSTSPTPIPCAQQVSFPWSIARDSVGNIYVGGTCVWGTEARDRVFVVKLDAAGNPVSIFGGAGVAADFYSAGGATAVVALQPAADGAIYVGASAKGLGCNGVAIVKLGADGKLVDAFGGHGIAMPDLSFPVTLAIDSSARLYAGGQARPACVTPAPPSSFAIYRFSG
jgi:hypothetical protein